MDRIPPKVPPRNHPIHIHNRLKSTLVVPETHDDDDETPCASRRASSVGFVDVDDLLKFQEDDKKTTESASSRIYTSIRHIFSSSPSSSTSNPSSSSNSTSSPRNRSTSNHLLDSHINPMFAPQLKTSITFVSRSLTHLPYPPKKRKSHIRRVFSCFSIFRH